MVATRNPEGCDAEERSVVTQYTPTDAEQEVLDRQQQRRRSRGPAPGLKAKPGAALYSIDHEDPEVGWAAFKESLGTCDADFVQGIVSQLSSVARKGPGDGEEALNYMLAAVRVIQPRDEVEAMLASQMVSIHMLTMTFARRLNFVENIQQQDSASNALNKLARTYAAQLTALKNYRTGGEQRVTVQHVNVNQGGQAIVGEVHHGSPGAGACMQKKG